MGGEHTELCLQIASNCSSKQFLLGIRALIPGARKEMCSWHAGKELCVFQSPNFLMFAAKSVSGGGAEASFFVFFFFQSDAFR